MSVRQNLFAIVVSCAALTQAAILQEHVRVDGNAEVPTPGQALHVNMFADDSLWKKPTVHWHGRIGLTRRDGVLAVEGLIATNRIDTAWCLSTKALPLSVRGRGYALSFHGATQPAILRSGGGRCSCAVVWYGRDGREVERDPFPLRTASTNRTHKVFIGRVPQAAESYSIRFGFDKPDLFAGQGVRLDGLSFSVLEQEADPAWTPQGEIEPPRVRVTSETPFKEPKAELRIAIECPRPIDWSAVAFRLDGKDATAAFARDGNAFVYRPATKWEKGLHVVVVSFVDPDTGERRTARKTVFRGKAPRTPRVRLREDGITLVDGEPFFPIGVYGIVKSAFNGNSLDRALADLKLAGVNTVHSYRHRRSEEFLSAADRHGLKVFSRLNGADKAFVEETRHHPSVLAWYVGDDTSMHADPFMVYNRSDSVKAVDPTRITAQADAMNSGDAVSSYRAFVKTTDVFLPEIYPCKKANCCPEPTCVAQVIRDMKRFKSDVAEAKDTKPHAVWPIIQCFRNGRAWERFPTRDELFAMSFATLAHGAQGITWYAYCEEGVTATPETWANFTNLTSRIAELAPALALPIPLQPKAPKVLAGPEADVLGNPTISVSLRRAGCDAYLLAVNSSTNAVVAELDFFDEGIGSAEVMWEGRTVKVSGTTVREVFAPFDVFVYHWRTPDVELVAHQGEEALAPSHSRSAYELSVKHGLERIKLDIRVTKDGEIVLQHDDTLKAVMGWDVRIKDVTLAEIREKGRCRPRGGYTNETIVTLAEALEYGKRTKKGIWLDFKNYSPALVDRTFGLCEQAGLPRDRIMVATWSKSALRYVKKHYPDVKRVAHVTIRPTPQGGFTANAGEKGRVYATEDELIAALLRHRDELGLYGFNIPHSIGKGESRRHMSERFVRTLKKNGCWVSVWQVNDGQTGELYRGFGADNFVTSCGARTKRTGKEQRWE